MFNLYQVYIFAEADDFKNVVEPLQNVARKFKPEVEWPYVEAGVVKWYFHWWNNL